MAIYASRLRRAVSLSSLLNLLQTPLSHSPSPPPQFVVSQNPKNSNSFINFFNCRGFRVCNASLSSRPSRTASYGNSNDDNKISPDEILFEGCDYNHWLITMDFPKDPKPSAEEMVETYVQTAAKVFGSVEEAKKKIYACSTTTYEGFQVEISEQDSEKFKGLPGVVFVLPDSYIDPVNKEYGGDKYINGTIIHRPPPVSYGRSGGRYGDRNRDYNRPNRQESMQGDSRNFGPPQNPPPQQNYGPPRAGPPQQNYGPPRAGPPQQNYGPRAGPPQQNYGPPGGGRDAAPMCYSPAGNENYQGDRRNPLPTNQESFNQGQRQNSYPPGQRGFPPVEQANSTPEQNRNFTSTQGGGFGQGLGGNYGQSAGGNYGQGAGGNYGQGAGGNYGQGAGGNYGKGAVGNYGQGAGGNYGQGAGGNYGQESMQGDSRNFGPPQNPPPQQNYGPPGIGSPQQNYGPPRAGPSQQNYGPPGAGWDTTSMSYSPAGNDNYQGDRRDPLPDNQENYGSSGMNRNF